MALNSSSGTTKHENTNFVSGNDDISIELNMLSNQTVEELMLEAQAHENSTQTSENVQTDENNETVVRGEEEQISEEQLNNWRGVKFVKPQKIKPNEKCPCGSTLKFKKCCKSKQINLESQTRYELQEINSKAIKLYNKTISEGVKLVNPDEYIQRQDVNRTFYEKLISKIESSQNKEQLMNTNSMKYFTHMYNSFPPGFGHYLNQAQENKETVNITEVFYNLRDFQKYKKSLLEQK